MGVGRDTTLPGGEREKIRDGHWATTLLFLSLSTLSWSLSLALSSPRSFSPEVAATVLPFRSIQLLSMTAFERRRGGGESDVTCSNSSTDSTGLSVFSTTASSKIRAGGMSDRTGVFICMKLEEKSWLLEPTLVLAIVIFPFPFAPEPK